MKEAEITISGPTGEGKVSGYTLSPHFGAHWSSIQNAARCRWSLDHLPTGASATRCRTLAHCWELAWEMERYGKASITSPKIPVAADSLRHMKRYMELFGTGQTGLSFAEFIARPKVFD